MADPSHPRKDHLVRASQARASGHIRLQKSCSAVEITRSPIGRRLAIDFVAHLRPRVMSAFPPLLGVERTSVVQPLNEYAAFCNGPGDVKSPRVIVTLPSSRFCPWSAPRPPHYAVRRNGEPI